MNISSPFVTDAQTPESVQPAQRPLDHPSPTPQMLFAFNASPCDPRRDAALTQPLAMAPVVVALVGVQLGRAFPGPACQARDRRQRLNERLQKARVMNIGCRQLRHQWHAALIDDDMVLAAELSPVRGIAAGVIPAEGGKERWPSRYWRVPIRSDRIGATCAARTHAGTARLQRFASRAAAASTSYRCRSPFPAVGTPTEYRCAGRKECRSTQRGRSSEGGPRWGKACEPAAAVQWPSKAHRKELAWP